MEKVVEKQQEYKGSKNTEAVGIQRQQEYRGGGNAEAVEVQRQ